MRNRFKTVTKAILAFMVFASVPVWTLAQQVPHPENLIRWRQSAFNLIAWNTGRIKASLDGQYNKDEVIKAANAVSAIANSGIGALFVPGTEQGKGWHDTNAQAALFKEEGHFRELGVDFAKEAAEMARIAAGGDAAAVKAQYGKLSRTCKACHEDYKRLD